MHAGQHCCLGGNQGAGGIFLLLLEAGTAWAGEDGPSFPPAPGLVTGSEPCPWSLDVWAVSPAHWPTHPIACFGGAPLAGLGRATGPGQQWGRGEAWLTSLGLEGEPPGWRKSASLRLWTHLRWEAGQSAHHLSEGSRSPEPPRGAEQGPPGGRTPSVLVRVTQGPGTVGPAEPAWTRTPGKDPATRARSARDLRCQECAGPIWFPLPRSAPRGAPAASAALARPPAHGEIDLGLLELWPEGKAHLWPRGSRAAPRPSTCPWTPAHSAPEARPLPWKPP